MKNGVSSAGVEDPPVTAPVTVLLADEHPLVRDALKSLTRSMLGAVRIVEAADGDALLEAMRINPTAGLALVDTKMPAMNGGHRLREFARRHPPIPVVVVSALTSLHLAQRLLDIDSVFAVVPKSAATATVRAAIACAMTGRKMPLSLPQRADAGRVAMLLTPRQRQICALLRQGMSNKMIANALGIGEGTVKNHVTGILRMLNAANRTHAALLHPGGA
jgi:DNA-binding NarL/FixJ family response regulator